MKAKLISKHSSLNVAYATESIRKLFGHFHQLSV